jgi:hypothetical protein
MDDVTGTLATTVANDGCANLATTVANDGCAKNTLVLLAAL